jgi:hypothetical protein
MVIYFVNIEKLLNLVSNYLQVVYRYWERSDVKGVVGAMEKMADHAVSISCWIVLGYFLLFICLNINGCGTQFSYSTNF